LRRQVLRQRLAQAGAHLVAGAGAPPHLPGVGQEDHRPDDAVGEGAAVPVAEVGGRPAHAVVVHLVPHERDGGRVGPERGSGERQTPGRRLERLAHGVTPRERVAGVVDLVEDDQGAGGLRAGPVEQRPARHLRVRDDDAVELSTVRTVGILETRVDADADPVCRVSPLGLEVLGRSHDGDPLHDP
jgi:hypothetical protein